MIVMFETPPEIDITFTAPYTATGLTFTFSPSTGQYCSKLRVRWYSGTTLLADTTAEPDDPQWVLTQTVESFDRINIQLLATKPPRALRQAHPVTYWPTDYTGRN